MVSPFEALSEQANWLGASIEGDVYGKGLFAAKVPKANIVEWYGDAQLFLGGNTMLVFNTLDDLESNDILPKTAKIN